jgi:hypothetical protein
LAIQPRKTSFEKKEKKNKEKHSTATKYGNAQWFSFGIEYFTSLCNVTSEGVDFKLAMN